LKKLRLQEDNAALHLPINVMASPESPHFKSTWLSFYPRFT